jgi:hypothetical protein
VGVGEARAAGAGASTWGVVIAGSEVALSMAQPLNTKFNNMIAKMYFLILSPDLLLGLC